MIVSPDAKPIDEIVIAESWSHPTSQKLRMMFTEIDEVYLLCRKCSYGQKPNEPCKIPYWIRGKENTTECVPKASYCPKCPQWECPCGCH